MENRRDELIAAKRDEPVEIDEGNEPMDTARESAMKIWYSASQQLQ